MMLQHMLQQVYRARDTLLRAWHNCRAHGAGLDTRDVFVQKPDARLRAACRGDQKQQPSAARAASCWVQSGVTGGRRSGRPRQTS